ncbi:MAG: hypothetical protein R2806_25255 [Saprospiraceae bacterium]
MGNALLSFSCSFRWPYISFEHNHFIVAPGELATIPPDNGHSVQPGLAGAFTGVHNNALIIAGSKFSKRKGVGGRCKEVYHDAIYVLEKAQTAYQWFEEKRFSSKKRLTD